MDFTEIALATGDRLVVQGAAEEVEKTIVAASRGSIMQLAWFTEAGAGNQIGINPSTVVSLRSGAS